MALPAGNPGLSDIIPAPVETAPDDSENFALGRQTRITVLAGDERAAAAGKLLADALRPATGFPLPVSAEEGSANSIALRLAEDESAGEQGYRLDVSREQVRITAPKPAGLFSGVQTLRQLLPDDIERAEPVERDWVVAGGSVEDRPRYPYRGTMLDVARHFFSVGQVKRFIDRTARYKINYFHLHLTDDQGWRIQIDSWPKLATVGGANEVGGGKGGYYTKKQYRQIVEYAAARGVTIVPEIDLPGHTNAALHAYPELNCDGKAPPPYTKTLTGFSSLCIGKDITYRFARDVIAEIAELTPGPYLHLGGDEADKTSDADFRKFFAKVLPMVAQAGKVPVGWHEYAKASLPADAVVQYWRIEKEHAATRKAAASGNKVLMSPAQKTYLDMKYEAGNPWGNKWAGPVTVRSAYDWDPANSLSGVDEGAVLGVEAPMFTDLVATEREIERMTFPRLQAIAEVGWSPQGSRNWAGFRERLAASATRMKHQGVDFYRSPEIPW